MIRFLISMSNLTFECCYFLSIGCCLNLTSKTTLLKHVPTKCQGQNDRMGSWIFQLDLLLRSRSSPCLSLLRCLCLSNSFYRRYVSCMYNISNRKLRYPIYQQSTGTICILSYNAPQTVKNTVRTQEG